VLHAEDHKPKLSPTQAGSGSIHVVDLTKEKADYTDTDDTDDEEDHALIKAIRNATRNYKNGARTAAVRQLAAAAAATAKADATATAEAASLRRQLAEAETNLRKKSADAADMDQQLAECRARLKAQAATGAAALEALLGVAVALAGAGAGVRQPCAAVPWTAAGGGEGGVNDVLDWANRTCCGADEAMVVGQVVGVIKGQKKRDLLNQYVNVTLPRVTSSPLATALLKLAKGKKIGCN